MFGCGPQNGHFRQRDYSQLCAGAMKNVTSRGAVAEGGARLSGRIKDKTSAVNKAATTNSCRSCGRHCRNLDPQ